MGAKAIGCRVCGEKVDRKGLCSIHYDRFIRNGTFDSLRPDDWGKRSKHPLWERWKNIGRGNNFNGRSKEWDDFWQFVADVGEIPSDRAKLVRLREHEEIGPNNWGWQENEAHKFDVKTREGKNAYMRDWHKRNKGRSKEYEMKRRRNMTMQAYNQLLEEQDGVCAICKKKDEIFQLAIDHNHTTNVNRGLLCSTCNRGLGMLKDSIENLESAITYLKKYS